MEGTLGVPRKAASDRLRHLPYFLGYTQKEHSCLYVGGEITRYFAMKRASEGKFESPPPLAETRLDLEDKITRASIVSLYAEFAELLAVYIGEHGGINEYGFLNLAVLLLWDLQKGESSIRTVNNHYIFWNKYHSLRTSSGLRKAIENDLPLFARVAVSEEFAERVKEGLDELNADEIKTS